MSLPLISTYYKRDIILGIATAAIFIFLANLNSLFVIGLPQAQTAEFAWAVGIAPVVETFLVVVSFMLAKKFLPTIPAILVVMGIFSAFHFVAYGSSLATFNTGFIGAAIFGSSQAILLYRFNSITPLIISHTLFNFYLLAHLVLAIGLIR